MLNAVGVDTSDADNGVASFELSSGVSSGGGGDEGGDRGKKPEGDERGLHFVGFC